jgi:hypothetical protein
MYQVEYRDEGQLQQQQAITPCYPALARGNHAADIGVGQHDEDARAEHREQASCGSQGGAFGGARG